MTVFGHRFTIHRPEEEQKKVIKFTHITKPQVFPAESVTHFRHRPRLPPQVTVPPRKRMGRHRLTIKRPAPSPLIVKPQPLPAGSWRDLLSELPSRMNMPPVLDVGGEKVTVFSAYEPSKSYIANEHFEAISKLELNDNSEIFITIDNHPAPARWSKEGIKHNGQLKRRKRVAEVENIGRQRAIDNGSDYLMIVECDLLPPPDAYRRLRTLIVEYGADIAFLPYTWHWVDPKRGPYGRYAPLMGWRGKYPSLTPIMLRRFLLERYPSSVTTCGLGCSMFTRSVFEKKPFELDPYSIWCTDGVLAKRVQDEDLKVLGDNRLFVQHICCVSCYKRAHSGEKPETVDVRSRISELFEGRNIVVKEI